ncbi:MAG: ATP-binding protein [Sedimentisphaerales bacterium]
MTLKACIHEKIISKGVVPELRHICAKILCHIQQLRYSDDDLFAIHLAMEEAVVNAVKHGNKQDPARDVVIEYDLSPEKIDLWVTDQGKGFDSDHLADPRLGDNIYKTCGRGVLLIRSYMDAVEYNQSGNSVHMVKLNSKSACETDKSARA